MGTKQGYAITTWRLRLRCKHPEWLETTQNFYNEIQKFYYDLYLERPELWNENSQNALRGLETLSIPGRTRKQVEYPLPWDNALLYFRRSAANAAIAAAKSYLTRSAGGYAGKTETFHSAVTYYKGMYRELTSHGVELRVWTGDEWHWMHCRLYGKKLPEDGQLMSPSVVYEHPYTMLQVPVKEVVQDASGLKERIAAERNVCGVQFGTKDVFAVASVLTADGKEAAVRYFKGGNRYGDQCRRVVEHIDKSHASHGENGKGPVNQTPEQPLRPPGQPGNRGILQSTRSGNHRISQICRIL